MPYADPTMAAESARKRCRTYYELNRVAMIERSMVRYHSDPARSHAASAKWKAEHPDATRAFKRKEHLRRAYGLTPEAYDALLEAQDGACAGCHWPFEVTPHVDHCHASGRVRGLLCKPCNTVLGMANDNTDTLRRLAAYLEG